MKWKSAGPYHQESNCGRWLINKATNGKGEWVYMLVRKPGEIVKVGTLAECREAAK